MTTGDLRSCPNQNPRLDSALRQLLAVLVDIAKASTTVPTDEMKSLAEALEAGAVADGREQAHPQYQACSKPNPQSGGPHC